MNVSPVFTNFIAEEILKLDTKVIADYALEMESTIPSVLISNYGGWHSKNLDFKEEKLKPFFTELYGRILSLHEFLGFKPEYRQVITQAWININRRNDYNTVHQHPGAFFSGCFYVKVPKNSGKIKFLTPIDCHCWAIDQSMIKEKNHYNASTMVIEPEENMLLMFPPWLEHHVLHSQSDEPRISIAFNTSIIYKKNENDPKLADKV